MMAWLEQTRATPAGVQGQGVQGKAWRRKELAVAHDSGPGKDKVIDQWRLLPPTWQPLLPGCFVGQQGGQRDRHEVPAKGVCRGSALCIQGPARRGSREGAVQE